MRGDANAPAGSPARRRTPGPRDHGRNSKAARFDIRVGDALLAAGVDFAAEVPCNIVTGIARQLKRRGAPVVEVTREEEGVGVCAGAALAGRRPAILLQNSGLGNCGNALVSLTGLYRLPLVLVVGWRGGPGEPIVAQRPMGRATRPLLDALGIPQVVVRGPADLRRVSLAVRSALRSGSVTAILLRPEVTG
jgi:sulfopyruvate decarboxylase alpha subunit